MFVLNGFKEFLAQECRCRRHAQSAGTACHYQRHRAFVGGFKKTVSRIINNSPLVRKDTRDKVEALMREVGYTPDPLARGLAFRRSFLIGMVYDNPTAQYVVDMQNGALTALRGSTFELVVHPCDTRSPGYIEGVKRFVRQQKLHGVILVPRASEDQALADMLDEIGCRFTRIAALPLDETSQMVITHDRDGAAEAPITCCRWATATSP